MNRIEDRKFRRLRQAMIATIERELVDTQSCTGFAKLSKNGMAAMAEVPRHAFVPAEYRDDAYGNSALPIGFGQTISQPFIVALMTELLAPQFGHRVLEIGTGCGYQAAVLSRLVEHVYTIERVTGLATQAADRLRQLGYSNVMVKAGDGCKGWPEFAPFDGIVVTAGGEMPPALVAQLAPGGRLVIPVGPCSQIQYLTVLQKQDDGALRQTEVLPVRFVPLLEGMD